MAAVAAVAEAAEAAVARSKAIGSVSCNAILNSLNARKLSLRTLVWKPRPTTELPGTGPQGYTLGRLYAVYVE